MTEDLLERKEGRVAILTMNRPDRLNAMSGAMLDALLEALDRLASDDDTGCVILTGAGRGFCAGGDVKAMAEGDEFSETTMEGKAQALRAKMETSRLLHEMPKPTIAMVRGPAAGAGLSLALGMVNKVVPDDQLEAETMALAEKMANGPGIALGYMKRNMNAAETGSLRDCLDLEAWHHTRTGMTEDHREATKAFVDKRAPVFKGR